MPADSSSSSSIPAPARPELWRDWFRRNRRNRPEPDWTAPTVLTRRQRARLLRSLQHFALGDGGGPGDLIGHDRAALILADPILAELTALWMAEEREHSRLLSAAVGRYGGTLIASSLSFRLFILLRHRLGIRAELTILVLTEIVSHAWYQELARLCPDEPIRQMARLLIRDEAGHLAFHLDRLRTRPVPRGWSLPFVLLGLAAAFTLWLDHGGTLRVLGGRDRDYARAVWRGLRDFSRRLSRASASPEPGAVPALLIRRRRPAGH